MAKKKRSKGGMVVYALVVLVILSVVGVSAYFTNFFTTGFKTFYLSYNGKMIVHDTKLTLPVHEELRFDLKYVFGFLDDDTKTYDYTVQLGINKDGDNDFVYVADDKRIWFIQEADLSQIFNLDIYDTYFTINIDKDMTEILAALNDGQEIAIDDTDYSAPYYFYMTVNPGEGKAGVTIIFRADVNIKAESITLDKGGIVF